MKNGGPAFPVYFPEHEGHEEYCQGGMTLRDWFAGQALAGLTSTVDVPKAVNQAIAELEAKAAYIYADAMLKARGEV